MSLLRTRSLRGSRAFTEKKETALALLSERDTDRETAAVERRLDLFAVTEFLWLLWCATICPPAATSRFGNGGLKKLKYSVFPSPVYELFYPLVHWRNGGWMLDTSPFSSPVYELIAIICNSSSIVRKKRRWRNCGENLDGHSFQLVAPITLVCSNLWQYLNVTKCVFYEVSITTQYSNAYICAP